MNKVLQLIKKDALLFTKDPVAMALTYLLPLLVIFLFGSVLGVGRPSGVGSDNGPSGPAVVVVNQSDDRLVEQLVEALREEGGLRIWTQFRTGEEAEFQPFTEERAREWILGNRVRYALVFPPDAVPDQGLGLKVRILDNPVNQVEEQIVKGLVQRTLFTTYPRLLIDELRADMEGMFTMEEVKALNDGFARTLSDTLGLDYEEIRADFARNNPLADWIQGDASDADGGASEGPGFGDLFEQVFQIEEEQLVGGEVRSPQATRLIGGWAVMFLLFSLTGAASSLFEEKKAGIFYRLLSGPITRDHMLLSKFGFLMLVSLSQLLVCFVGGWFFFGVEVFPFMWQLVVVSCFVGACCTAFGMLLSSISRTAAQANGYGTMLVLTMSAVGGAWFPVSLMPDWVQVFSKFTLVYWAVESYQQVLWAQAGIAGAASYLGVLLAITAVILAVSLWRFRVGDLFR